jgi:predicted RNA-binding Zn-ribbon protein involved in translation (DUF1610 family)
MLKNLKIRWHTCHSCGIKFDRHESEMLFYCSPWCKKLARRMQARRHMRLLREARKTGMTGTPLSYLQIIEKNGQKRVKSALILANLIEKRQKHA